MSVVNKWKGSMKFAARNKRLALLGSCSLLVASSFGCTPNISGRNGSNSESTSATTQSEEALVTVPTTEDTINSDGGTFGC